MVIRLFDDAPALEADSRLPERFWRRVKVSEMGCWLWLGHRSRSGYGAYYHDGRMQRAHRVAYTVLVGEIPDGLVIDHLCRVRECVNPAHLEPVTLWENTRRGIGPVAQCAAAEACPDGHLYDEANTIHYRGYRYCRECRRLRCAVKVPCPTCGKSLRSTNVNRHRVRVHKEEL